jgi:hypothetical protein
MSKYIVEHAPDKFDSRFDDIWIMDGSPESLNHEQGPMVIAKINSRAFSPHIHHALKIADIMAAAPDLLEACKLAYDVIKILAEHHNTKFQGTNTEIILKQAIDKAEGAE